MNQNTIIKYENWTVIITPTAAPWLVQKILKSLEKRVNGSFFY